jgi:SAM-dependent methyltransferase
MTTAEVRYQDKEHRDYAATDDLFAIERALQGYNRHIVGKMIALTKPGAGTVLDYGAGIGTLAQEWQRQTGTAPDCCELDPKHIEILKQRRLRVVESATGQYDVIFTSNVIEHIADDARALAEMYGMLKKGGRLAVYVPAFMLLWSAMDPYCGHYRRYGMAELKQKVRDVGFRIDYARYSDSIGFVASLYLKSRPSQTGAVSEKAMRLYDRAIYPLSRLCDAAGMGYLLGKNIMLVATKV